MAYMPLNKDEFYLEPEKMTRIYDLSMPWGWDTPLWPFPGARSDLTFPRGQYLERFHKRTCTYTGTLHAGTHLDAPNHTLPEEEVDRARYGYTLAEVPLAHCIGSPAPCCLRYSSTVMPASLARISKILVIMGVFMMLGPKALTVMP